MGARSSLARVAGAAAFAFVVAVALHGPSAGPVEPPIAEAAAALHEAAKASTDKASSAKLEALAVELESARALAAKGKPTEGEAAAKLTLGRLNELLGTSALAKSPAAAAAARAAAVLEGAMKKAPPPPPPPPLTTPLPRPPTTPPIRATVSVKVPTTIKDERWLDRIVGRPVKPPIVSTSIVDRPKVPPLALGTTLVVAEAGGNQVTVVNDRLGLNLGLDGNPGTNDRFESPRGVAIDARGRVYVVDAGNHRIVRMNNMGGECWVTYGRQGSGAHEFRDPGGIALDSSGRIYVADAGNHRIVRIDDMSGANWTSFGTLGDGVNQFQDPEGVFIDRRDAIVVADTGNHRIARFTSMTGAGWSTCCGDPSAAITSGTWPATVISSPTAIAEDREGRYHVTSSYVHYGQGDLSGGQRVVRIDDMTGRGMVSLGGFGAMCDATTNRVVGTADRQLMAPNGLAFNADGHLFIADSFNQRVIEVNGIDGAGWRTVVGPGAVGASCYGSLYYPWGLAVSRTPVNPPTTCEPVACPPYQKTCDGRCVNIDDPRYGCSATSCSACTLANVSAPQCSAARTCDYDRCNSQRAVDLDGNRANGCEVANDNLVLWLDAGQRTHVLSSGMSIWGDRAFSYPGSYPTGQAATTEYSPEWPTWQGASGSPAMPSVRFGVSSPGHKSLQMQALQYGPAPGTSLAGKPYTILAVVQRRGDHGHNDFFVGPGTGCGLFGCNNGSTLLLGWANSTQLCLAQWGDDVCLDGPRFDAARLTRSLVIATNDGRTKTLRLDEPGVPSITASRAGGGFTTSGAIHIGGTGYRSAPDAWFDGEIFEILAYDAVIPPALLGTMTTYLKNKYGIR